MAAVERWIAESPYSRFLGVELAERATTRSCCGSPGRELQSRGRRGGCAASLGAIGAQALTRAALGPDTGTWHTAGLQVSYLAAAIGETILARARLLRRGKEMCFAEVDIETEDRKPSAHVPAAVRGRFGAPAGELPKSGGVQGRADPGTMGPHIGAVAFIGNRGIRVEHMTGGSSRLVMPWRDTTADQDGNVHEGAVLALLDTRARWRWAETEPWPQGVDAAIQAQIPALAGRGAGRLRPPC
jgi:acyl-coenzyme A thioesterase PaaI-like protein